MQFTYLNTTNTTENAMTTEQAPTNQIYCQTCGEPLYLNARGVGPEYVHVAQGSDVCRDPKLEADYKAAARELKKKIHELGFSMTAEPIPDRTDKPSSEKPTDPSRSFASRFIMRAPSGRVHVGEYSAGCSIPINWALENRAALRAAAKGKTIEPFAPSDLQHAKQWVSSRKGLTLYDAEMMNALRKVWIPELVDVFSAMLMDAASLESGITFREWCNENDAGSTNPADALDTLNACKATFEFLMRELGQAKLNELRELAGRL